METFDVNSRIIKKVAFLASGGQLWIEFRNGQQRLYRNVLEKPSRRWCPHDRPASIISTTSEIISPAWPPEPRLSSQKRIFSRSVIERSGSARPQTPLSNVRLGKRRAYLIVGRPARSVGREVSRAAVADGEFTAGGQNGFRRRSRRYCCLPDRHCRSRQQETQRRHRPRRAPPFPADERFEFRAP